MHTVQLRIFPFLSPVVLNDCEHFPVSEVNNLKDILYDLELLIILESPKDQRNFRVLSESRLSHCKIDNSFVAALENISKKHLLHFLQSTFHLFSFGISVATLQCLLTYHSNHASEIVKLVGIYYQFLNFKQC